MRRARLALHLVEGLLSSMPSLPPLLRRLPVHAVGEALGRRRGGGVGPDGGASAASVGMAAGSGWWQDMWGAFSSLSRPAVAAMRGGLVGCPWLPSSTADARLHVHADAAGTAWWELAGPAALWLACEEAKSARATLGRRRIGMMPELKVRSARVVAATGDDLATAVAVRHSTPHHVAFASTSGVFDRSARGVILSCPMQDPAVVERSCCDAQALSVLVPSTSTSVPVDSVAPWMRPADLAAAPWSSARRYVRPAVSAGSLAIATAASRAQMDATGRLGAATVRWPQLRASEMLLPAERESCARLFERGESADITRAAAVTALHHHPLLPFFASAGVAGQALLWRLGRANGVCRFEQLATGVAEAGVYAGHRLSCVQWSPQGDRLATADSLGGVWVWDSERPETALAAFRGHTRKSSGIAFLDAGNVFAVSGSSDGSALGSEAASYGGPSALRHAEIPAVPPLPRGSLPSVRVFDMRASHRARCVATVSATVGSASAIACAPGDRALIVGGSRGDLGLFDLRAMCLVHHHGAGKDCHTRGIRALTVDPSGSFVASGGGDGSVRLWGVPSLKDIGSLPGLFAERTFVGHKLGDGMVSRAGVTGLVLTDDSLFASGTGGFVYALPKRWV